MTQPPAAPRTCPTCGTANKAFATFCHECGESLEARPVAAPAAAPPTTPATHTRRWEIWLGLALIAGVLGFALLDWSQREAQARQYHSGEVAVAARHWDVALAAFGALGTYRDSPHRKTDAAAQIQIRDTTYQAGLAAATAHDWVRAYRAFSETIAIEPDYRDAPARFAAATQELPHAVLADTIYRRTDGASPGLYLYRASGGDSWLPGSDAQSLVRAYSLAGEPVVYDGPIPGATPFTGPPADNDSYNIPALPPDRRLLLIPDAAIQAGPPLTPTVLPAALGTGGSLLASRQVVWNPAGYNSPPRYGLGFIQGNAIEKAYYYDLNAGQGGDLSYPGSEGYVLLNLNGANTQRHWVLGYYGAAGHPPYQTTLYLLGDSGAQLQPVAQVAGIVFEANLSPDGRYLLYKMSTGDIGQPDLYLQLVLIDLQDPTQPARLIESLPLGVRGSEGSLRAQFMPGPGPPRVVIRRVVMDDQNAADQGLIQLDLWSMAGGTTRRLWEVPKDRMTARYGYTAELYWLAPDGTSLTITMPDGNGGASLRWQPLDGTRPAIPMALPDDQVNWWEPVFPGTVVDGAADYSFYYVVDRDNPNDGHDSLVYGVVAAHPEQPPVLLYTRNAGKDVPTVTMPLPSRVVVFEQADHTIQVGTFDGSLKLPALPGIDMIVPRSLAPLYPAVLYPGSY